MSHLEVFYAKDVSIISLEEEDILKCIYSMFVDYIECGMNLTYLDRTNVFIIKVWKTLKGRNAITLNGFATYVIIDRPLTGMIASKSYIDKSVGTIDISYMKDQILDMWAMARL